MRPSIRCACGFWAMLCRRSRPWTTPLPRGAWQPLAKARGRMPNCFGISMTRRSLLPPLSRRWTGEPPWPARRCWFPSHDEPPALPNEVGAGKIGDFAFAPVQDCPDHVEIEVADLVQFEGQRHGQFLAVDRNIDQCGPWMRECLFQGRSNLFRIRDAQAENPYPFGDLGKIQIDQVRGRIENTGCVHLRLHKAKRSVVEDDDRSEEHTSELQ